MGDDRRNPLIRGLAIFGAYKAAEKVLGQNSTSSPQPRLQPQIPPQLPAAVSDTASADSTTGDPFTDSPDEPPEPRPWNDKAALSLLLGIVGSVLCGLWFVAVPLGVASVLWGIGGMVDVRVKGGFVMALFGILAGLNAMASSVALSVIT